MTLERQISRKLYGLTFGNGYWGKMNKWNCSKFKSPDILTLIKMSRLEWIGTDIWMSGDKEITARQPERRRFTWIGVAEVDLRGMKAKDGELELWKEQNGHLSRGTLFWRP